MLSDRFRAAVEAGEIADATELFREDAVFRSPVVYRPSRDATRCSRSLKRPSGCSDSAATSATSTRSRTATRVWPSWSSRPRWTGGKFEGIDKLNFDEHGRITELKVMLRPASALQVVGARMGEEFSRLGLASA